MKSFKAVAAAAAFACSTAFATPVVIWDTMPVVTPSTVYSTFAEFQWFDLAAGFTVASAGTITHITTGIKASPQSYGAFTVGVATNAMIGNPATPTVFAPPPGSLFETKVCSSAPFPLGGQQSACAREPLGGGASAVQLGLGQYLDIDVNISVPAAGTYWVYTRFRTDSVFATWDAGPANLNLIARRTGTCTTCAPDSTFVQATAAAPVPGLRITFDVSPVPEPASWVLAACGVAAIVAWRRPTRAG